MRSRVSRGPAQALAPPSFSSKGKRRELSSALKALSRPRSPPRCCSSGAIRSSARSRSSANEQRGFSHVTNLERFPQGYLLKGGRVYPSKVTAAKTKRLAPPEHFPLAFCARER